ncbi:MAG: recombination mediator RecR [Candidatus Pacebacteria bacterium]|nr:recombination mediator RecR [Candidatus Paceibacterota bacterium]
MYPSVIEKLIRCFSRFPTVGPKTATRFVFFCLSSPQEEIDSLINNLQELKKSVKSCEICFRSVLKNEKLCSVCENKKRNHETICVVEKEADLVSIEKTGEYKGIYFILGGSVSPLRKDDFKKIRGEDLRKRVEDPSSFGLPEIKEVIIATNQTTEGDATAIYISRILEKYKVKVTRIGRGLPTGGEIEYADEETVSSALKNRR